MATPATPMAEPLVPAPAWTEVFVRAPRAAAVGVIATLSFGLLIGGLAGGSAATPFTRIIVALEGHAPRTAQPASTGVVSGGGGSGGGGGPATITVTNPAPTTTTGPGVGSTGSTSSTTTSTTTSPPGPLPPVKHVFLVVLSNEGYQQTFGHTALDPYLARTLVNQGGLLPNYYSVAAGSLANEIAIISGQGPTVDTGADCPHYVKITRGEMGGKGQVLGAGCVYPRRMPSLASQLTAAGLTWKVYLENESPSAGARTEACRPRFGASEGLPTLKRPYARWRNPFLYLGSVVDKSPCPESVAGLSQLARDLKQASDTPSFSYIVPNVCKDGAASCDPHQPSPMAAADAFLKRVIPEIEHSAAFKDDGLIAITFDQAQQSGPNADPSSCCDNPASYPNDPTTTTTTSPTTTTPPSQGGGVTNPTGGGGRVGLLLISPYIKPGTLDVTDYYNHFSLLASLEDLFGLRRIGYAKDPTLPVFGAAVYTNWAG